MADWFDSSWKYRQVLNITNSTTNSYTDYQIAITINTSSLVSSKKLNPTCSDLRFTDDDGHIIPHWIKPNTCNTTSTTVWLKVPIIEPSSIGTSLYFYYGNPGAKNTSDGKQVFEFFDDFDFENQDWIGYGAGVSVTSGSGYMQLSNTSGTARSWVTLNDYNQYGCGTTSAPCKTREFQDSIIEFKFKHNESTNEEGGLLFRITNDKASGVIDGYQQAVRGRTYNDMPIWEMNNATDAGGGLTTVDTMALGYTVGQSWYEARLDMIGSNFAFWPDRVNNPSTYNSFSDTSFTTGSLGFWIYGNSQLQIDWIFVRKYPTNGSDPSAALSGSEETSTSPIAHWKLDDNQGYIATNKSSSSVSNDGLVGFWTLDSIGTTLTDALKYNNLTSGGTSPPSSAATSIKGSAGDFAASYRQHYYCTDANCGNKLDYQGNEGKGGFTISVWVNSYSSFSSGYRQIISKGYWTSTSDNGGYNIDVSYTDGFKFRLSLKNSSGTASYKTVFSKTTCTVGEWYHLVGVYDGGQARLYINGRLEAIDEYSGGIKDNTSNFTIGSYSDGNSNWDGAIDHVKIWQRALSDQEILAEYSTVENFGYLTNMDSSSDWIFGKIDKALDFDGSNDSVNIPHSPTLDTGNDLSISAWIYWKGGTGDHIYINKENSYEIRINAGYLNYAINPWSWRGSSNAPISQNQWHHVVVTHDGDGLQKIFVDGIEKHSEVSGGNVVNNTNVITLAARSAGTASFFNGYIDNVKIYNYPLSADQIKSDFNDNPIVLSRQDDTNYVKNDWFSGYQYRQKIMVNNSSTNQILINLNTSSLISAGKLQSDCDDIRFTDAGGQSLNYWIEGGCNTTSTNIWVDTKQSGHYPLFMYYGNSSASSDQLSWSGNIVLPFTASCPSGWTRFASLDNRIPRGYWSYGGTGSGNHSHTISGNTGGCSNFVTAGSATGSQYEIYDHTHTYSATSDSVDPWPNYIYTIFCYRPTIPQTVGSANLVGLFDNLPSGWSRVTAMDNRFPRGQTTYGTTGGGHSHTVSGNTSTYNPGGNVAYGAINGSNPHSHSFSGSLSGTYDPPYVNLIYASNATTTTSFPTGIIAMFTDIPPLGWIRYIQLDYKFPRAASTASGYGGSDTHTHSYSFSTGTGASDGKDHYSVNQSLCAGNHTHTISGTSSSGSNIPPYLNMYFYKRLDTNSSYEILPEETGGLSAYWSLDDGTNFIKDKMEVTHGNLASGTSAPTWSDGAQTSSNQKPMGKSLLFDGNNDYAYTNNDPVNGLQQLSLTAWIKPDSSDLTGPIAGNPFGWYYRYGIFISSGTYYAYFRSTGGAWSLSSGITYTGGWDHVAITYNNGTASIYVNGKLGGSSTFPYAPLTQNSNTFYIGTHSTSAGDWFKGNIDDIKVFSYALNSDQINIEYNRSSATVLSSNSYAQDPNIGVGTTKSPIVHWKFNEGDGSTSLDSSGNVHNVTLGSGSTWDNNGKYDKAIKISGGSGIGAYSLDSIDFDNTNKLTVSFWLYKTASSDYQRLVGKYFYSGGSLGSWLIYFNNANKITFTVNNGSSFLGLIAPPRISNNTWYHVTGTYDGTYIKIYINGVLENSTTHAGTIPNSAYCLTIGYTANTDCVSSPQNTFYGSIDDVKIWKRTLSDSEIFFEYQQNKPYAHWSFDRDEHAFATNKSRKAVDSTGLVGFWTMDSIGSTIINFTNTTSNTLSVGGTGTPTSVDGYKSNAADFVATSKQRYYCTDANCGNNLDYKGNGLTISSWVRPDSSPAGAYVRIIEKAYYNSSTDNGGYTMDANSSGNYRFCLLNSSGVTTTGCAQSTTTIDVNNWTNVTGVYDGRTIKIFINGTLEQEVSYMGGIKNVSQNFTIGSDTTNTYPWDGKIDHVKVWQRALTDNEVLTEASSKDELYAYALNTSLPFTTTGLVGNASQFSGVTSYLNSPGLNWTPSTFSVSFWLYPTTLSNYNQQLTAVNGWNGFVFHTTSTGGVYVGTDVTTRFTPTQLPNGTVALNQWQHFVYTYNGTQGSFYKNGVLLAGPTTQNSPTAWGGFNIGVSSNTIQGSIDEVKIYPYSLSQEEINAQYHQGLGNFSQ